MKFCKDCAHYQLPFDKAPPTVGVCNRKDLPVDLVTGLPEVDSSSNTFYKHPFCKAERVSLPGNCGRDAIHFQPKKDVPDDYVI